MPAALCQGLIPSETDAFCLENERAEGLAGTYVQMSEGVHVPSEAAFRRAISLGSPQTHPTLVETKIFVVISLHPNVPFKTQEIG